MVRPQTDRFSFEPLALVRVSAAQHNAARIARRTESPAATASASRIDTLRGGVVLSSHNG
jgi:hypothetical protein